jgi:hypothetical protein
MTQSYQTLEGSITFRAGSTTRSVGVGSRVAIVGGYNASEADPDVTAGESASVATATAARQLFGAESELARLTELALGNGAGAVNAVPVAETQTTESVSSSDSGTLSEIPLDPNVQPEHQITVTDTSSGTDVSTEIVYEDPVSTPDSGFVINPVTGEWAAASASSYDIQYTYGDYQTAVDTAVRQSVRAVIVASESDSHASALATSLTERATNLDLKFGVIGARPTVQAGDTVREASRRLVEVTPPRATSSRGPVRTVATIGGLLAANDVGASASITYDSVVGLTSLATEYTIAEAQAFEQRTAITRQNEVAEGVTTADDPSLRPTHVSEILDVIGLTVFETLRSVGGDGLRQRTPTVMGGQTRRVLSRFANGANPLLASVDGGQPYRVNVTASETGSVDATVTVDPIDIVDDVQVTVTAGDVIDFAVSA